jgi:hypothetical protein
MAFATPSYPREVQELLGILAPRLQIHGYEVLPRTSGLDIVPYEGPRKPQASILLSRGNWLFQSRGDQAMDIASRVRPLVDAYFATERKRA